MKLPANQKIPTDQLRKMAVAALLTALDGDDGETKEKSGRGGFRKLAAGAVISAAGYAAFKNRDLIREQLQLLAGQDGEDEEAEDFEDEEAEDELVEEPEAEEPEPDDAEDAAGDEDEEDDEEAAPARRKRPSRARA